MSFANPLLLIGLAAVAVPVLVHLVHRMERRGDAFPSLMFVSRTPFQARRHKTLRDRALLALRCLAVALLALAFAGPELAGDSRADAVSGQAQSTVLLIDRSYSMGNPARWSAALEEARRRIDALAAGHRIAIVAFDDDASVIAPLTDRRELLHDRLDDLEPGAGGTRLAAGVDLAGRVLQESGAGGGRIVLVSDLQRSALVAVDRLFLDDRTALEFAPVEVPVRNNAAVMSATLVQTAADGGSPALDIRVRNTGMGALDEVEIRVEVDGRAVHRRSIALAAGEERSLRVPVALALDRASPARVVLGEDDLAADNEHHLVLLPNPPVELMLLTRPAAADAADPAVFLEQALQVASTPSVRVTRQAPQAGQAPDLARADVLVADAAVMRRDAVRQAAQDFVQRGGGLLLFMAGQGDAGAAAGGLPALQGVGALRRHADPGLGVVLATGAGGHPLWDDVGADIATALAGTRLWMSRQADPGGGEVLARLSDGAPWLIEQRTGAGRVVVMTSGITRPWGNLALEPGFVPLLHELTLYLAQRPPLTASHTLGDVVDLRRLAAGLPGGADWQRRLSADAGVVVELPGGGQRRLGGGEPLYRSAHVGMHQAHLGGARSLRFAVNADRRESLLASASPVQLMQRIVRRPAPPAGALEAGVRKASTPLGWYLLAAALALLWLESQMANRLSWRRQEARAGG